MSDSGATDQWRFYQFGMIVTGDGEAAFLPAFMRSVARSGDCHFRVIRQVPQRSAITSSRRKQRMVGTGKSIPDRDADEIGFPARQFLTKFSDSFVFLIDDLEDDRRTQHQDIFERYTKIFDTILSPDLRPRAAVHFFVNMVEAYFFADARAIHEGIGIEVEDFHGDVETIRHPKNDLKRLKAGFDEKEHGAEIVNRLDLERVLDDPDACASLRTLFKWCCAAKRDAFSDRFQLKNGVCSPVTESQIDDVSRLYQV
jgi:hypothetical protein